MGNVLRGGINSRRRIKIMKADGSVMKVQSCVFVKQIVIDYPNHGIFEAPSTGPLLGMGTFTRPLPERTELIGGHLYYLIPLSFQEDQLINYSSSSNSNSNTREPFPNVSFCGVPSANCRLHPPSRSGTATDSTKQQEEASPVVSKINRGGLRIVSSSYSTHGSTMRVKIRLRKEEAASFLSGNNLLMENVVVPTTIRRATQKSALSSWKPSLDTIAELRNPLSDS